VLEKEAFEDSVLGEVLLIRCPWFCSSGMLLHRASTSSTVSRLAVWPILGGSGVEESEHLVGWKAGARVLML